MAFSTKILAFAIAIAVVITCHAVDAARMAPVRKNGKHVGPSNTTINSRPHARTLYSDGDGNYINTDSVHHYASGVKCWTDYFVVDQNLMFNPLVRASDDQDCSGTSECQIQLMKGYQTCQTWSESISAGIESDIVNFGVSAGFQTQDCNSASDTTSCTWDDMGCHSIWSQQQVLRQGGYMRRRCSSDNGDYTAWTKDFQHDMPTNVVKYNCGVACTSS